MMLFCGGGKIKLIVLSLVLPFLCLSCCYVVYINRVYTITSKAKKKTGGLYSLIRGD